MSTIKLKLLPRATLKGKVGASFPANVVGIPPITITPVGGSFQISIDIEELRLQLLQDAVIELSDGATNVALDAALGNVFYLGATINHTILVPSNKPAAGFTQRLIIRHEALGGLSRTLSLTTGSAGAFRFGTFVSALSATTAGAVDYIGAIYNHIDDRWDVVSYSKGL